MLSREQIIEAIRLLDRVGITLVFGCPHPCGHMSMSVSSEDAASYALGEINLPAQLTGLTPAEFAEWVESGGYVQCSARTLSGRRCKNFIRGHQITNAQEWKRVRDAGPYCPTHGG